MSDHQTVTGTLTASGATSAVFYLRPDEVVAVTATFTGTGKVSLSQVLGQPAQAYRPLIAWTTSQSATQWRNTTNQDLYLVLRADRLDAGASVAYTLADVEGDQILAEWYTADGTLAFRITDQGPVGGQAGGTLDVRAFGAVGDGVTDDGAAINAAISALPANGGDILLPPGDYMTSVTIAITKPGVRLIGSNGGSWRAGAFSQVPALTTRSTTNIIGTTASMTVVQCNAVGNLGVTTEQAGPVIMNLSIWDNAGRIAGAPGTMTLLHLRDVNRWTVQNVGLFWGSVGAKLQKGTAGDNAGWVVNQVFAMGCATGGIIDTYSGHWQNGWISLCGTALDCDLTEGSRPSSIRISDIKFDILDPTENATYAPGVGIEIGEVETVHLTRCTFENQPGALAAPTTTAILINPADSLTTRVILQDCVTVEHEFGIDCEKALFLKVNGHIHRTRTDAVGGTAAIRITSCVRATIAQSLSDEHSEIPIQLGALAQNVTITDTDAVVELV